MGSTPCSDARLGGRVPPPYLKQVQIKTQKQLPAGSRISNGALYTESAFLTTNSRRDAVISASEPKTNVSIASARPMMVRYWKCQP